MLEFNFNQTLPCGRPRQLYSCFHLTLDYPHLSLSVRSPQTKEQNNRRCPYSHSQPYFNLSSISFISIVMYDITDKH